MILVDTHVALWLAFDPSQISAKARTAIENARETAMGLAICDVTILELATLVTKGKIRLDVSLESFLEELESRFVVLPITARACVRAVSLPSSYPNDPADRIIGATALVEGLPLVTADRAIRQSAALRTIW